MLTFEQVKEIATNMQWAEIPSTDPHMVSFGALVGGSPARINVWIGRKGVTVGTYINHPKKGKTQLFRRHCDAVILRKIFFNPRVHTNRGYSMKG